MLTFARGYAAGKLVGPELRRVCVTYKLGPLESVCALAGAAVAVLVDAQVLTVDKPKLARLAAELGFSWSA